MSFRTRVALPYALIALSSACAATRSAAPADALAARFALADAQRANTLAPDLYARAERARAEAREADDESARKDHTVRARLLLDAAIAEADRIAAEREGAAADARADRSVEERAALERRRLDLEQAAARELAAQAARAEAERALAPATSAHRESDAERVKAASFLCDRAALTLAGALALGLPATTADALERTIAAARLIQSSTARVKAAKHALERVQEALETTRAALPPH